jgi:hypothetical protein
MASVRVDLYQDDGSVRHLGIHNDRSEGSFSEVVPGTGIIVAIGSAWKLDLEARTETENASDYLVALRTALRNAKEPPYADVVMVTMRPTVPVTPKVRPTEQVVAKPPAVEPAVPKPRPAEPVTAKVPAPRPAALRPAKCSNIVSRAQLGETLTDAELTALRTECRS